MTAESFDGHLYRGHFAKVPPINEEEANYPKDIKKPGDAFFLWPDRLRWDFFVLSFLISIPIFFTNWIIGFFALSAISFFLPFIVFYFFRIPLLDYLDKTPLSIQKKIYSTLNGKNKNCDVISACKDCLKLGSPKNIRERFCKMAKSFQEFLTKVNVFPPIFKEQMDQINYSPNGSFKESLMRVTLAEMYQKQEYEDLKTMWLSQSFRRWLFYWGSPIWGGYLNLLTVTFIFWFTTPIGDNDLATTLGFSSSLWTIFSLIYIRKESTQFGRWAVIGRDDEKNLPPLMLSRIKMLSHIVDAITEEKIKLVSSIITGIASTAYLAAIKFFIFQQ